MTNNRCVPNFLPTPAPRQAPTPPVEPHYAAPSNLHHEPIATATVIEVAPMGHSTPYPGNVAAGSGGGKTLVEKLREAQHAKDQGLITAGEFDAMRASILASMTGNLTTK